LTTVEPDEQGKTARIEQVAPESSPPPAASPEARVADEPQTAVVESSPAPPAVVEQPAPVVARPLAPQQQDVVFVPLAVNVGDGFKFGCGFFLAFVLAMLVGFVLLAALFVLTSLFGLNLPISR
jgi:hypothetical protein